jgi:hypothetical protein
MRQHLDGRIASAGFASGDRFVVGDWRATPIGPMNDVFWAAPSGERVLLVPSATVGDFVSSVYRFDRIDVVPFVVASDRRTLRVVAGDIELSVHTGPAIRVPFHRPCWFTRVVEDRIAGRLVDVHTFGTSPTGVREWYRATALRIVRAASARIDGRDLGAFGPARPALRVGFGEAPRWPSIVELRTTIDGPRTDANVAATAPDTEMAAISS